MSHWIFISSFHSPFRLLFPLRSQEMAQQMPLPPPPPLRNLCYTNLFASAYFLLCYELSCFRHVWLCKSVDCSPPGSSAHGILQARILERGCHAFLLGIFPTLLHLHIHRWDTTAWSKATFHLCSGFSFLLTSSGMWKSKSLSHVWLFVTPWMIIAHQAPLFMEFSWEEYEWVAIPFSRGSSQPRDWTTVSCIAGRFFSIWAIDLWSRMCTNRYLTSPLSWGETCPYLTCPISFSSPGSESWSLKFC